jgi:hypothetical protein
LLMPSDITKRRCKQIRDQASEYLNFWLDKGLPGFMLWAAIVYTSGVILHHYNVLFDVDFQIITSLALSPFLVVLLLYSWSLLTQDRLQVLGTEHKPLQTSLFATVFVDLQHRYHKLFCVVCAHHLLQHFDDLAERRLRDSFPV